MFELLDVVIFMQCFPITDLANYIGPIKEKLCQGPLVDSVKGLVWMSNMSSVEDCA